MQVEGVLERSARREDKTERLKRESVARDAVLSMYADRFGDHVGVLPRTQGRPRRSLRRRYTVDLTSQNLAFEKPMRPSSAAGALPSSTRACSTTSRLRSRCGRLGCSSPCCSAVEVLLSLQAFKLEGLSQAARSRVRLSIGLPD